MSDKEIKDSNKDLADAEFEAFLQGGDELALLLQDLSQDTPSAELDAAIMADAEAALAMAGATTSAVVAANDANNPDASPHRPSFLWRWKTPLGLAASVLLAVPLFLLRQEHEEEIEAANTRQAEEKVIYPQEVKNGKIAARDYAIEPKARAERRADAEMKSAPVAAAAPPREASAYAPPAPAMPANPAPPPPAAAAPAPVQLAEAPSSAPKAIAGGMANEKMPEVVRHAEAERAKNTESFKIAAKEEAPRQLAKEAEADSRLQAPAPPLARAASPLMAKSAPAAATSAPLAKPAMDSMNADKKADVQADKQARVIAAQPVQTLAAVPPAQAPDAPDWQAKIEKLLKEKQNHEALEEWKKFRAVYPDFVVDKSLQKKIEALQK